jgi:hypothetical protein
MLCTGVFSVCFESVSVISSGCEERGVVNVSSTDNSLHVRTGVLHDQPVVVYSDGNADMTAAAAQLTAERAESPSRLAV